MHLPEPDSYFMGAVWILLACLLANLGLHLVRKSIDRDTLIAAHDVSGQFLALVGTMYAVLLGLVVVDAIQRFYYAESVTASEANALSNIAFLASCAPDEHHADIRRHLTQYIRSVVDREWKIMAHGQHDTETRAHALQLMAATRDWEPTTERQKAAYASLLEACEELWNQRRERTQIATRGIRPLEWAVLLVGALLTIAFTYFFVLDSLKVQILMTSAVAIMITLNIFLVIMFGYPFSGDNHVSPDPFLVVLETLNN